MKNIVIFGAPGAGKGTQSDFIVETYGLTHVSTGDLLRKEIADQTELGKRIKSIMDNGQPRCSTNCWPNTAAASPAWCSSKCPRTS